MFRLRHHDWVLRLNHSSFRKRRRELSLSRRLFRLEHLENRCMLSTQPWVLQGPAPAEDGQVNIPPSDPVSGAIQVAVPNPTDPSILYVGAVNGGVWKSINANSASPTWTPLTDALPSQSIASLSLDVTDPTFQTLIAGTGRRSSDAFEGGDEAGLYYTTDGGSSWTQFNQSFLLNQSFYGVAARGNLILAGSVSNGIYRSLNRGANWTLISGTNGLPTGGIFDLVGDPGNSNRFYAGVSGHGVFRSDDGGATWTNVSTGLVGAASAVNMRIGVHDSAGGNVVYAGLVGTNGELSGIFRSTSHGTSWTAMDVPLIQPGQQGEIHFSLAADPNNPNLVYVGGDRIDNSPFTGNIWRGDASLAHGTQFTSIVDSGGSNTSPHADSRYMGFNANGDLLEGDDGGIYRRSNPSGTGSWGSEVGNLAVIEAHDVAWDSISHTALIGTQDNGTEQQPAPAGTTTWQLIGGGDGGDVAIDNLTLAGTNDAIRYYSAYDLLGFERDVIDQNNNVLSSTNIDTSSISDPQFYTPIKLNAIDPHRLLVGGFSNLYESFNQGDSFVSLGPPGANGEGDPLVYGGRSGGVANPDLIYVGVDNAVYIRTTAGGPITATSPLPAGASTIVDITVDPFNWKTVFAIDDDQVFMSQNAGANWADVTGNLLSVSSDGFRSLQFVPGFLDSSVIVGTRSGVFASHVSAIGGWEPVGTALPNVLVSDLDYNAADDVLVAATLGRSVWTFANASSELNPPPTPLDQTFDLHSDPTATKKIYLDFNGENIRNTPWNTNGFGNLINLPFDLDGDLTSFDPAELDTIQSIWERVSEDFRPFDVDVTTEDPGVEALKNTGSGDTEWGQRVVIGGSAADWYTVVTGSSDPIAVKSGSFFGTVGAGRNDTMAFVFATDLTASAGTTPLDALLAEVTSHVIGTSLGLSDAGQRVANPNAPPPFITAPYPGHGTGATSWESIMGTVFNNSIAADPNTGAIPGFDKQLTQWSQGEYQFADPIDDELDQITAPQTGLAYRPDDHSSSIANADPIGMDSTASTTNDLVFSDEGIIEQNTDKDFFSFTVDGLGGILNLDVSPADNGPNLDVLAKILDSSGNVLYTSNPRDDLLAGSQTLGDVNSAGDMDGGWLDASTGEYTDTLFLQPGTYYLSVEGTGRPADLTDPMNPDWGYTNYGSLGYYSISGDLQKGLVVGVDFDVPGGNSPENWNQFTGGGPNSTLTDLISESGAPVPYQLSINTTDSQITTSASSAAIDPADVPTHAIPLDNLDGYLSSQNQTLTFTWSNLEPWSFHEVYIFGGADFEAHNVVTVTGGNLNGTVQTFNFTQVVAPGGLEVNSGPVGNDDLSAYALDVLSDGSGQITISVTNEPGFQVGIAGLAIVSTRPVESAQPGSISGEKWNDANGNQIKDTNEDGLGGWIIYLDTNNNGQLDSITTPDQPDQTVTQASPDIPQNIADYTTVKSELDFPAQGTILDVNVALDITHTYDSDLTVSLISPSGTSVILFSNIGPQGHNFHNTVLDDSALVSIDSGTAPYTGTFQPEQPFSLFNGEEASGSWKLQVYDDSAGDTGVLNSWSLTIKVKGAKGTTTYLEPYTTTDSAGNYSFTNLDPGLYYVREYIQPDQAAAGWQPTWAPTPITVTSGADIQDVNFGNWIPTSKRGSISGTVYLDANQNGAKDTGEQGQPGWIVYIDSNNNGVRDIASTPTVIPATNLPKPITDFHTTTSQVTVGSLGTVLNVQVTLDITHSFVGDLSAYLVGPPTAQNPTGRVVTLFNGVGGQYNDFHNLTLSDDAARSISTIGVSDLPYTGTWQPQGLLSDFTGDDAAGTWTLVVSDNAFADEGTLNSWSLSITTGELFRTTDSNGNYEFDNVVPGQYNVREEPQNGWTLVTPSAINIPGATWSSSQWNVTVVGVDNPSDPDGPDSHRNVKNVNFANTAPAASLGDFNHDGIVDGADFIIWRRTVNSNVTPFSGADGNGDGIVNQADYNVWRTHFGQSTGAGSGSGLAMPLSAPASGLEQPGTAAVQVAPAIDLVSQTATSASAESISIVSSATTSSTASDPAASSASTNSVVTTSSSAAPVVSAASPSVSIDHDAIAIDLPAESASQADLALLNWLASSAVAASSDAPAGHLDSDSSAAPIGQSSDALDAAFDALEDDVLVTLAV